MTTTTAMGNAVTKDRTRMSGHDNNEAMGNTTTMNTMSATGGITVADTMTTGTAGTTTTLHDIGDGSSGGSDVVPSAIPCSIVAQARGPIAFLKERAAILSQRADEAAAFARAAVTDAQDFTWTRLYIIRTRLYIIRTRLYIIRKKTKPDYI